MHNMIYRMMGLCLMAGMLVACATPVPRDAEFSRIDESNLPTPDQHFTVPGLSHCTTDPDTRLRLNSEQPVTIIVHGCFGSAARFRALSQVFAFHGQQSICFSYNDRDSLDKSADELVAALDTLSAQMQNSQLTVIGHSQGGLISRRALTDRAERSPQRMDFTPRLVTISSPFGGIAAASHCGSTTARWISLGLVVPVCRLISGGKWYEITQPSPFIQQPGTLLPQVVEHLKIVTDERDSCRRTGEMGRCAESDFVFTSEEQYFEAVDSDSSVKNIEITAGHAEIVGDHQMVPYKLISLLQQEGIMRGTEASRQAQLERLLARLYLN